MIRQVASSSSRGALRASLSAPKATATPIMQRRLASGGGASYNEPTGNLFGEKTLAKGEKRQKESWELLWYWGMFGGLGLAAVLKMYQPDTTIESWAKPEARKNLEASGKPWKYEPSPNSGYPDGLPAGSRA